jgi:hypothetical protein
VAVGRGVNLDDKGGEENVHSEALHANEAAPILSLMCPEAVQWIAESWDVEAFPDEDSFAI